ncbi:transcriptional regulator [Vibrio sp. FNV 38]|nr:transcriptional regulator [Vibrio sp. FNV 38]
MSNLGSKFLLANRFLFDPNNNSLLEQSSDEIIRLGSNESRILLLLVQRPNDVVTRTELHEYVWREQGFEVDDSSLTQAISTLRKLLKDSTKSPEFVKTVPKRGYQLICNVEESSAMAGTTIENVEEPSVTLETEEPAFTSAPIVQATEIPMAAPQKQSAYPSWLSKVFIALACLFPLLAVFTSTPEEQHFRELGMFETTPVLTPINHPNLDVWLPSIKLCVTRYVGNRTTQGESKPIKVIATGGQSNFLVLNYIHPVEDSGSSYSQQLVSKPTSLTKVCE